MFEDEASVRRFDDKPREFVAFARWFDDVYVRPIHCHPMIRSVPKRISLIGLLVALSGCELDDQIVLASRCFDIKTETYVCCDPETPRSFYMCDAGVDAEVSADASDDGEADAGSDDGGPPAAVCPWPCTPVGGGGFDPFPSYVWMGEEAASPPPGLDGFVWTSWVDVKFAEPECPACSCSAPTNPSDGCVLPMVWSVESTVCQDPSSPSVTPFDPPLNWAGSCTSTNPIAAGILCDGEPCVKSLVVQAPTIAPCVAAPAMPPEGQTLTQPTRTKVVEYVSAALTTATCGTTHNCIAPPPPGYQLCLVANGFELATPCPNGWTDRRTGWRIVKEQRACSACTCGAPQDGSCEVLATVYSDDGCGNVRGSVVLPSNQEAKCTDLPVGTALGSKTAEIISYQAGTCTPSKSEVIGDIQTDTPVTYCCMPLLDIPN